MSRFLLGLVRGAAGREAPLRPLRSPESWVGPVPQPPATWPAATPPPPREAPGVTPVVREATPGRVDLAATARRVAPPTASAPEVEQSADVDPEPRASVDVPAISVPAARERPAPMAAPAEPAASAVPVTAAAVAPRGPLLRTDLPAPEPITAVPARAAAIATTPAERRAAGPKTRTLEPVRSERLAPRPPSHAIPGEAAAPGRSAEPNPNVAPRSLAAVELEPAVRPAPAAPAVVPRPPARPAAAPPIGPPAAPRRAAPSAAGEAADTVEVVVRIGRIDVRTQTPPRAARALTTERWRPALSLDDYLAARRRGES